ncbi:MAG: hypothetical protein U0938_10885 [Thiobacillus sp.]|nr:hypothetical protein [Thiobacillus sp.]
MSVGKVGRNFDDAAKKNGSHIMHADLISDHPHQMQGIGMIGGYLEYLLANSLGLDQTTGLMMRGRKPQGFRDFQCF